MASYVDIFLMGVKFVIRTVSGCSYNGDLIYGCTVLCSGGRDVPSMVPEELLCGGGTPEPSTRKNRPKSVPWAGEGLQPINVSLR